MTSLLPMIFSNWWEDLEHPHHIPAQHFATEMCPDQMGGAPMSRAHFYNHPMQTARSYYRPRSSGIQGQSGLSVVKPDKNKFHVTLDTQQFAPNEIKVKVVDNYVVVEGKHDEKRDEHGSVTRQFIRKYLVPEQCDIDNVTSTLSSDGLLTLNAPRKHQPAATERERMIQIEQTGKPAVIVDDKTPMEGKGMLGAKKNAAKGTEEKEMKDDAIKNGEGAK